MKSTLRIAVLIVACLSASAAQAQETPESRTWAIGWDNGIGMRHLLSDSWGVGLQVDPGITSRETDQEDGEGLRSPVNESDGSNLQVGVMVFKEKMLSKHLGVGPYCRASYSRSSDTQLYSPAGNPYTRTDRHIRDAYGVDIGIRPTFRFEEWLVLETRFGLMLTRANATDEAEYDDPEYNDARATSEETKLDVFGTNLGPGAVMQFMVYLW